MSGVLYAIFAPLLPHQFDVFIALVNGLPATRTNEHRPRLFGVRTPWVTGVSQTNITHTNKFSNLSENSIDNCSRLCYNVLEHLRTRTLRNKCSTLGLLKKQQILTASVKLHRFIPSNLKHSENLFVFITVAKSLREVLLSLIY